MNFCLDDSVVYCNSNVMSYFGLQYPVRASNSPINDVHAEILAEPRPSPSIG
jgi:hypothetical protein